MADHPKLRTATDFNIAFNGLLTVARMHKVDLSQPEIMAFLSFVAEQVAEGEAQNRRLYNIIHKMGA